MGDMKKALNNYVRGQGLVALIMGILFCVGFTIIDFPMAIGLGIMIGIMDLVPYLHTFALIPTVLLALLKAADTGQNFWIILLGALIVFIVVQLICDMIVTPKVMGSAMGLNPAILLLSLSVWGALLGFIGLIIALPLTTLLIKIPRINLADSKNRCTFAADFAEITHKVDPLAQSVEHNTFNVGVLGSSPKRITKSNPQETEYQLLADFLISQMHHFCTT